MGLVFRVVPLAVVVLVLLPVPGTVVVGPEVVLEVVPGTVAVLEAVPGTVVGPGTEVGLGVDLEAVPGVGPGIEAVPAWAEEEHSLVVVEEELRAQTGGELADPALSHAWALHSCQYPAWEAPCEAGDIPEDSRLGDHNPLGAWRGCWGRGNPGASDPWPSSSEPPPASDARSSGTPPQ